CNRVLEPSRASWGLCLCPRNSVSRQRRLWFEETQFESEPAISQCDFQKKAVRTGLAQKRSERPRWTGWRALNGRLMPIHRTRKNRVLGVNDAALATCGESRDSLVDCWMGERTESPSEAA